MGLFSSADIRLPGAAAGSTPDVSSWIRWLARLGYAARGVVYLVVGGIAVQAAISNATRPADTRDGIAWMAERPFGQVLLLVIAVGLAGYALWRVVQAIWDPERAGDGAKGLAKRTGYLISGAIHAGLAFEAFRLLVGTYRDSGGDRADHWTALAMAQPAGRWIIAAVGAGVIGLAAREFYRAYTARFARKLDLSGLGVAGRDRVIRIGRFGIAARGVVFGIVGWFLIQAALQSDPSEAQGFGAALQTLREQGYGPYLLGVVAAGLMAFGAFEIIEARYRRIRPP